jgi:hypothetical protein
MELGLPLSEQTAGLRSHVYCGNWMTTPPAGRTVACIASSRSRSMASDSGYRWPYRSSVKLTEVWPARTATSFGVAPAAIHSATAVCRRSWIRKPSRPANLMAGTQKRARKLRTLSGPRRAR